MTDRPFIAKLRTAPSEVSVEEVEQKLVLDYIRIESYDLLISHNLTGNILDSLVELQPEILSLQDLTLLDCDLSDSNLVSKVSRVYETFCAIYGLWLTGASKIAHILNDRLFVILNPNISRHLKIPENAAGLVQYLSVVQQNARQVTQDFHQKGFSGSPEQFLSHKLGYTDLGYQKSLVKFFDEYYWLRFGDNLPIPPKWTPPNITEAD